MQITEIRKGRQSTVLLYADNEYIGVFDARSVEELGLTVGMEITDQQFEEIVWHIQKNRALSKAVYLLSKRDYTVASLRQSLAQEVSEEIAEGTVQRMIELGYVNDADYAKRYAAELYHYKRNSERRIRQQLLQKGISKDDADAAIEELDMNPVQKIREIYEKKYSGLVKNSADMRKAVAALYRMGYNLDDIRIALNSEDGSEFE